MCWCGSEGESGLDALFVDPGRGVVLRLVELVRSSSESTGGTSRDGCVADVTLGLLLVALLAGSGSVALDALGDVVGRILHTVNSLPDNSFIRTVYVGGRHV